MRVGSLRLLRIVRIVVRHRHHRDDLAGAHVGDDAGGGDRLELRRAPRSSSSRSACCTRRSTASSTGFCRRSVASPAMCSVGEPAAVEPFLDAGDALVVDVDVADHVRDLGAVRIDALVLGEEADAGNAEPVDFLLLLRRDLALEPDEAALRRTSRSRTSVASRSGITAVSSSTASSTSMMPLRLAEQRGRCARRSPGLRRCGRGCRAARSRPRRRRWPRRAAVAVGRHREHHEPARDDAVDRREGDDREPDARRAPWRARSTLP